jgi:hypothetical protein
MFKMNLLLPSSAYLSTKLHGLTTPLISTAVRTSNHNFSSFVAQNNNENLRDNTDICFEAFMVLTVLTTVFQVYTI